MDKITNDNMVIGMCIVWIVEVAFSFFIPKPTQTFKQP